jgi:hypothetical protein
MKPEVILLYVLGIFIGIVGSLAIVKQNERLDTIEAARGKCYYIVHNDTLFLDKTWIRTDGTGRLEFGSR